jgi:hypothetical protein
MFIALMQTLPLPIEGNYCDRDWRSQAGKGSRRSLALPGLEQASIESL